MSRRVRLTPKQRVLREYPGAWFNVKERTIEGYSAGLILGQVGAGEDVEKRAWADAARRLNRG